MRKGNNGERKEKTDENSGHYMIASSWPPERRTLEHHKLMPKEDDLKTEDSLWHEEDLKKEDIVWQFKLCVLLEVGGGDEKYVTPH